MVSYIKKFDKWIDSHLLLIWFLLAILVLRIPGFFEPYWYGDEAIYLTIGNALRNGARLYADIVDHKTPLIYYLAMVNNQMQFRMLLMGWMIVATAAFYSVAKKILKHTISLMAALSVFTSLTTLTWLEGHIPNGELFVIGFVMLGWWLFSKTKLFAELLDLSHTGTTTRPFKYLLGAGVLFSLAILTKVPAIMDAAVIFGLGWFWLARHWIFAGSRSLTTKKFLETMIQYRLILAGLLIPLVLSVIYFVFRGAGREYLDYGLLYNFHYVGNWELPFSNQFLRLLFTLPGKLTVIFVSVLALAAYHKKISPPFQLMISWLLLAILGASLSNRPYPHYYLQVVPPLSLLIGFLVERFKTGKKLAKVEIGAGLLAVIMLISVMKLLQVGSYSLKYYRDYLNFAGGQISVGEYYSRFNSYMSDNYLAAQIINDAKVDRIFIWGTNPMLYALTKTVPTGRFTVAFHIQDLKAYDETLAGVKKHQPEFIVVMNDESDRFPEFFDYLHQNYIPNQNFNHFSLWKKQAI